MLRKIGRAHAVEMPISGIATWLSRMLATAEEAEIEKEGRAPMVRTAVLMTYFTMKSKADARYAARA